MDGMGEGLASGGCWKKGGRKLVNVVGGDVHCLCVMGKSA